MAGLNRLYVSQGRAVSLRVVERRNKKKQTAAATNTEDR